LEAAHACAATPISAGAWLWLFSPQRQKETDVYSIFTGCEIRTQQSVHEKTYPLPAVRTGNRDHRHIPPAHPD